MTIDWTKPLQWDEFPDWNIEVLATDMGSANPILVRMQAPGFPDEWISDLVFPDGRFTNHSGHLINRPEKHVLWLNVYKDGCCSDVHNTRKDADKKASYNRIACVRIEFEEGEGL